MRLTAASHVWGSGGVDDGEMQSRTKTARSEQYSSAASSAATSSLLVWPAALYASVMYDAVFGMLSMGAVLAMVARAMLVLLEFASQPQQSLVVEGRHATQDIARLTLRVLLFTTLLLGRSWRSLIMEGRRAMQDIAGLALRVVLCEDNTITALCATASFTTLLLGQSRWSLVMEGRRATWDIAGLVLRVLLREGNAVAMLLLD
ncbi:uncharacterized protein [Setaria viridis]|uniref:uncharacterized protein n=1 Tax=Setaria viridis TaxID=4556 RepID=UPI003B3A4504